MIGGHNGWAQARLVSLCIAVLSLFHCADFRESEFECEHAVAHIEECCSGFETGDPDFCRYIDGGTCGVDQEPALSLEESRCIQSAGCESIIRSGFCRSPDSWERTCP